MTGEPKPSSSRALLATVRSDLLFYRRHQLVRAGAFGVVVLNLVPFTSYLAMVTSNPLRVATQVFSMLLTCAAQISALALLVAVAGVPRASNSRPGDPPGGARTGFPEPAPEILLLGHLASACLMALVLEALAGLLFACFLPLLGVSPQPAILYLVLASFSRAISSLAFMALLAVLVHPVIAVTLALVLQAGQVSFVLLWLEAVARLVTSAPARAMVAVLRSACLLLFSALPLEDPAQATTGRVGESLRLQPGDLGQLALAAGYSLLVAALLYLLAAARWRQALRPAPREQPAVVAGATG